MTKKCFPKENYLATVVQGNFGLWIIRDLYSLKIFKYILHDFNLAVTSTRILLPGGHSNGKRGYQARPWTHKKHPNHVFFRHENRPLIRVFACIFLNLPVMSFPKFVYMTKNTPFFPILHVFAPLNDVRAYIAWSWKTTLITWIFGRAWYPPWHSSGPSGILLDALSKFNVLTYHHICTESVHTRA